MLASRVQQFLGGMKVLRKAAVLDASPKSLPPILFGARQDGYANTYHPALWGGQRVTVLSDVIGEIARQTNYGHLAIETYHEQLRPFSIYCGEVLCGNSDVLLVAISVKF